MTENLLIGGDYVPDGFGGFVRKTGREGLLCEALFRLNCRRGALSFLPELGSRLHLLPKQKKSQWAALAQQYCAEALLPLGLSVRQVTVTEQANRQLTVAVFINDDEQVLEVSV